MAARLAGLVACLLLVAIDGAPVGAQSADLFAPGVLNQIHLFMNNRDLESLRVHYDQNTFYPSDFRVGNERLHNVALRSRGGGSRNASKVGLQFEFDRYVTGQTFAGRRTLVLDNLWQDPSMLRENATMALFARMGQAAPLESFCLVYFNEDLQGVYSVTEDITGDFLTRALGDTTGVVHEYHWLRPYYFEDLGDDLNTYAAMFEPRTHRTDAPATIYGPIREMVRAINQPFDSQWRTRVDQYVDLPQLVTHVAIESFLSELDGIAGYAGLNNFYLYRPLNSTRFQFLPWDRDNSFQEVDASIFRRVDENILVRRALAFPDLYTLYLNVLEQAAAAAGNGWLEEQIRANAALIDAPASVDVRTPYSNQQRVESIAYLISFAQRRPQIVLDQVRQARGVAARPAS